VDDPRRELAVAQLTQTFTTPAEVYSALDRLTRALRKELGESLPQIERSAKPLELVTTPSLPALQRYTQAMEFYRQGNLERFVDYAQSALELDPNFAMAHLYLGHAFERMGNLEASRLHMEKALAGLDRVGEREKLLILARDHSNQGRFEKAADAYRRLTDLYPDDIEGLRGLAEHAQWIGRPQTAVEAGRRVVQLVPHSAVDHARLLHYLNRVNQFDETLRLYQEAASSGLLTPHHRWAAGVALLARDDPEAARREFALLARSGGSYEENLGQLYQSRVLIYEGKLAEAEQALRTGIVLDQKYGSLHWTPLRKFFLARVQLLRDNRTEAARLSRWLASDTLKFSEPADLRRAVLLACQLEDLASAKKILVRFDTLRRQQESAYAQSAYLTALAAAQLLEGNVDAALESAQTATVYYTSVDSLLILAEVHSVRGDWRAAADAHLRLLNLKGQILNHEFPADLALTHLALAGSLEKMGTESEGRQALQEVRTFLHLWRGADAGLPALRQARALESRLTAHGGDVISDARTP
jgi:tetratricopeptide (TPR) repeat protein